MSSSTVVTGPPVGELVIVPRRHPGRWLAAAVIAVILGLLGWSVLTNANFGWPTVGDYLRDVSIGRGIVITLELTVLCMLVGLVLGTVIAIGRMSPNPVIRATAFGYIWFFRGTPVLVQLLFWFNLAALYPQITFGIPGVALDANTLITPMMAAVLGLGLNEAAYMAEIVRAGIQSVPPGQSEAASALGLTRLETMRRVILPQAMRVIIPPTGNETIGMLKTTSLVSVLAVPDLLYSAQTIYARTFETIPLLIVASIWYIVVTSILSVGQYYLERHYARGSVRQERTPLRRLAGLLGIGRRGTWRKK
ncbi:amino acid ABC transporter permease [Spongiactinospora rosea]|uniref:Amino acid ABC transporter permease n=1 Tax=Spongiactinospora rosea TaxID=2248750 RepID=A0A366LZI2_9ACTN|nr:amino acid ABC transporter permease [Spongiactinospora rosea]RBQ19376.1 amino acid ABC transporter permease [Spongiactinospora rosea]